MEATAPKTVKQTGRLRNEIPDIYFDPPFIAMVN